MIWNSSLDVNLCIDLIIKHLYLEIYKLIGCVSLKVTRLVGPSQLLPELLWSILNVFFFFSASNIPLGNGKNLEVNKSGQFFL